MHSHPFLSLIQFLCTIPLMKSLHDCRVDAWNKNGAAMKGAFIVASLADGCNYRRRRRRRLRRRRRRSVTAGRMVMAGGTLLNASIVAVWSVCS